MHREHIPLPHPCASAMAELTLQGHNKRAKDFVAGQHTKNAGRLVSSDDLLI